MISQINQTNFYEQSKCLLNYQAHERVDSEQKEWYHEYNQRAIFLGIFIDQIAISGDHELQDQLIEKALISPLQFYLMLQHFARSKNLANLYLFPKLFRVMDHFQPQQYIRIQHSFVSILKSRQFLKGFQDLYINASPPFVELPQIIQAFINQMTKLKLAKIKWNQLIKVIQESINQQCKTDTPMIIQGFFQQNEEYTQELSYLLIKHLRDIGIFKSFVYTKTYEYSETIEPTIRCKIYPTLQTCLRIILTQQKYKTIKSHYPIRRMYLKIINFSFQVMNFLEKECDQDIFSQDKFLRHLYNFLKLAAINKQCYQLLDAISDVLKKVIFSVLPARAKRHTQRFKLYLSIAQTLVLFQEDYPKIRIKMYQQTTKILQQFMLRQRDKNNLVLQQLHNNTRNGDYFLLLLLVNIRSDTYSQFKQIIRGLLPQKLEEYNKQREILSYKYNINRVAVVIAGFYLLKSYLNVYNILLNSKKSYNRLEEIPYEAIESQAHRNQVIQEMHESIDKLISTHLFWKSLEMVLAIEHSLGAFQKFGQDKKLVIQYFEEQRAQVIFLMIKQIPLQFECKVFARRVCSMIRQKIEYFKNYKETNKIVQSLSQAWNLLNTKFQDYKKIYDFPKDKAKKKLDKGKQSEIQQEMDSFQELYLKKCYGLVELTITHTIGCLENIEKRKKEDEMKNRRVQILDGFNRPDLRMKIN